VDEGPVGFLAGDVRRAIVRTVSTVVDHTEVHMPKGQKPDAKSNKPKLSTKEKQEKKKEKAAKKAAK